MYMSLIAWKLTINIVLSAWHNVVASLNSSNKG